MMGKVECKCLQCGKPFTIKASHAGKRNAGKYCSRECKWQSMKIKPDIKCAYCGKLFHTNPADKARGRKYCSRACAGKARDQRPLTNCLFCGKSFIVGRANLGKYCSTECKKKSQLKGELKQCLICKKTFYVSAANKQRGQDKYCSKKCYGLSKAGINSPFWKGGSFYSFGSDWYTQRRLAYERDNGICQHCGLTEAEAKKKYGKRNAIHHIVRRRVFRAQGRMAEVNHLTNLICLCPRCHILAENYKISIQPKLI